MEDGFVRQKNKRLIHVENIVTVLYMEYSRSFVFEGESHDFWEFSYIDKGSTVFVADEREFILESNEIAFHKPNEFHKLAANATPPNVTIVSFVCKSPAMKYFRNKIFKLTSAEKRILSALIEEGLAAFEPLTHAPPIVGMRKRAFAPLASRQMTFNLLEQFLITLLRRGDTAISRENRNVRRVGSDEYPDSICRILEFLEQHTGATLTAKDIARQFNLSENTLKKMASKYLGCGIMEKFNEIKLQRAKLLIRELTFNFTEIAQMLGFSSVHYFSRFFKKKTGLTPSEYQRSIKY